MNDKNEPQTKLDAALSGPLVSQQDAAKQVQNWQLADAKRLRAPRWLGAIAGGAAAVISFVRKINIELADLVSLTVKDGRRGGVPYSNMHLEEIAKEYRAAASNYTDLSNNKVTRVSEISDYLRRVDKDDIANMSEAVRKEYNRYYDGTATILQKTKEAVAQLEPDQASKAGKLWEQAYLKSMNLRESFHRRANLEYIRNLRQEHLDNPYTLRALPGATIAKAVAFAGAVALAVGVVVHQVMHYITRERDGEKQMRIEALSDHLSDIVDGKQKVSSEHEKKLAEYAAHVVTHEDKSFQEKLKQEREKSAEQEAGLQRA